MNLRKSFKLCTFRGAPVLAHWSVLIAFPFCWFVEKSVTGALIAQAAFLGLMLVHELGHALMAVRLRLTVYSIHLYAVHGLCVLEAPRSEAEHIAVAWGGVVAQAALFVGALATLKTINLIGQVPGALEPLFAVWVPTNMLIAFCNLIPIPPLDGATAWRFLPTACSAAAERLQRLSRNRRAKPPARAQRRPNLYRVK